MDSEDYMMKAEHGKISLKSSKKEKNKEEEKILLAFMYALFVGLTTLKIFKLFI